MKVGLTGGIGSGKSYVASRFELRDIPVYYADKEAKRLMLKSAELKAEIKALLGNESYHRNGRLNRPFVAQRIFSDKSLLKKMNKLVHPAVKKDFFAWAERQKAAYVLEESAILFENKLHTSFDKVILVTADKSLRINRVMQRDKVSSAQVESRIKNQFSDKKKVTLADFIIENNDEGSEALNEQIDRIHKALIKLSKKK